MKAYKLLFLILLVFTSCDNDGSHVGMVGIYEVIIPDTVTNRDKVQIYAQAEAYDGCWRDLYLELKKVNEFEYTLKAYGTFETTGVCPAVMVYKDTLIDFQPTQYGVYTFKVSKYSNKVEVYTMVVE